MKTCSLLASNKYMYSAKNVQFSDYTSGLCVILIEMNLHLCNLRES